MQTKIIEATNGPRNHGKFLLGRFDDEWNHISTIDGKPLLTTRGWTLHHLWVLDLQTGEGVCVRPGGLAKADLNKHKIWCCPLFEPFLEWLYQQDLTDIQKLPNHVDLPEAEFSFHGYRRSGKGQ